MQRDHKKAGKYIISGLLGVAFVAFLDYFIPVQIQLLLLYLIPLCYVALNASLRMGFILCLWAAACWWFSNLMANGGGVFDGIRLWNTFSRGTIFFTFVSLVHYFKVQLQEKEKAMQALRQIKIEENPVMGLRRVCNQCGVVQVGDNEWLPMTAWLSRDCKVVWADSTCPVCVEHNTSLEGFDRAGEN